VKTIKKNYSLRNVPKIIKKLDRILKCSCLASLLDTYLDTTTAAFASCSKVFCLLKRVEEPMKWTPG
jgi:hypothetical protein